jgi:hypothetical protein
MDPETSDALQLQSEILGNLILKDWIDHAWNMFSPAKWSINRDLVYYFAPFHETIVLDGLLCMFWSLFPWLDLAISLFFVYSTTWRLLNPFFFYENIKSILFLFHIFFPFCFM